MKFGNSAIAILPNTDIPTTNSDEIKVILNPKSVVADTVKNTQIEFWIKSLAITLIITLTVSFLMYLIVGYALYPLRELTLQIEDIQAKNLKEPILSKSKFYRDRKTYPLPLTDFSLDLRRPLPPKDSSLQMPLTSLELRLR